MRPSGCSLSQVEGDLTLPDGTPGFVFDEDDLPVGRVLDRREMVRRLGLGAPALYLAAGCGNRVAEGRGRDGTTICTARPRLTEGPYYIDAGLNRSDIRADAATGEVPPGVSLALSFAVSRISSGACTPLEGALVDVWHCDARGVYSGVEDPNFGDTTGRTWLRGHQLTDAEGAAGFTTIFPGWYPGRASHIHFTIRSQDGGADYDFTSQLFFEESVLAEIYTSTQPYTDRGDAGRLRNAADGIYRRGGSQLLLAPVASDQGYAATFAIGLVN